MLTNFEDISKYLEKHESYRESCLNGIASENYASPSVREFTASDFGNRYGSYTTLVPEDREYSGNKYIHEFEVELHELIMESFKASYVDLRPIGGHMAGMAAVMGLLSPGDLVLEVSGNDWGHGLVASMRENSHFENSIRTDWIPFDENRNIDEEKLIKMIDEKNPKLVILGDSGTLWPFPIKRLKSITDKKNILLAYDISHVSGLIVGGVYPNPLEEGVDVIFGSTHKSFPGPQGGMICTRDKEIARNIGDALSPALVTSHHLNRLPALAASMLEMKEFGHEYGLQIIKNSRALGKYLDQMGFNVLGKEAGYSDTHQIIVDIREFDKSYNVSKLLESANILISGFSEPLEQIRMGTQEFTRQGMKEEDMEVVAKFMKRVLIDKNNPDDVRKDVKAFVEKYNDLHYSFDDTKRRSFPTSKTTGTRGM